MSTQRLGNDQSWCVLSTEVPNPDLCLYRYELGRVWAPSLGLDVYAMLNPSDADHERNDLTVTKCMGFSRRRGRGGIVIVNAFALRTPYPVDLLDAEDPVGPLNTTKHLHETLSRAAHGGMIAAWGIPPRSQVFARRIAEVERLCLSWHCLGVTKDGHPRHPSRLAYATPFELLSSARRAA